MTIVPINISAEFQSACKIAGSLYTSSDVRELGQDMVELHLPKRILITCGWVPEGHTQGAYEILGTRGLKSVTPKLQTHDPHLAARIIESLVSLFLTQRPVYRTSARATKAKLRGRQQFKLTQSATTTTSESMPFRTLKQHAKARLHTLR
jgi:hypothetical protein